MTVDNGVESPSKTLRAVVAILVAAVATAYVIRLAHIMPRYGTDFDPIRYGAKLLRDGQDPYVSIGPGRAVPWEFRLLYPMPAMLLALPFTLAPIVVARALFVALSSGALAYVITRRAWWPLIVFASASWWSAIGLAQWSPIALAASLVPWLGFALAAKPNIGLAVLAASPTRRALIVSLCSALGLTVLSFALMPHWIPAWRDAIAETPNVQPLVMLPGGFLVLLAVAQWRQPSARLLLVLACVPMNPALYEGVLLFAVPKSSRQALVLAVLSWLIEPLATVPAGASSTIAFAATGRAMLWCMFIPAAAMTIFGHASRAALPTRCPAWLRGASQPSTDGRTHSLP